MGMIVRGMGRGGFYSSDSHSLDISSFLLLKGLPALRAGVSPCCFHICIPTQTWYSGLVEALPPSPRLGAASPPSKDGVADKASAGFFDI
jgi:hypothetical protein